MCLGVSSNGWDLCQLAIDPRANGRRSNRKVARVHPCLVGITGPL
jgi:hypothetical protein